MASDRIHWQSIVFNLCHVRGAASGLKGIIKGSVDFVFVPTFCSLTVIFGFSFSKSLTACVREVSHAQTVISVFPFASVPLPDEPFEHAATLASMAAAPIRAVAFLASVNFIVLLSPFFTCYVHLKRLGVSRFPLGDGAMLPGWPTFVAGLESHR